MWRVSKMDEPIRPTYLQALDALGNPILIGQLYGYSNAGNNGIARVVVGTCVNITENDRGYRNDIKVYNVTIEIWTSKSGCYELTDDVFGEWGFKKKKVSVRSFLLFPVVNPHASQD